jgi:hypothetical protein
MTLDDIMRDIQAMREDLLVFERKYGVPTEIFYEAYRRGEEPNDPAWVLDWSEWAATQQLLQERLVAYHSSATVTKSGVARRNSTGTIPRSIPMTRRSPAQIRTTSTSRLTSNTTASPRQG